jgi:flavin reductase (DIM6/NTAB) family NADH-FMN oxidoreductase RutF
VSDPAYPGSIFSLTNHELYIVTAAHDGAENGQIATWIMPATLARDLPRVAAILSQQNHTHALIASSGRFLLNMLADNQVDLVPMFGLVSGRDFDKFDELLVERTASGLPIIPGTCGWAECVIVSSHDLGDRVLHIADVVDQRVTPERSPLRKDDAFARLPADFRHLLEEKHVRDGDRDSGLIRRDF